MNATDYLALQQQAGRAHVLLRTITPERAAWKEALMAQYHRLLDEVVALDDMMVLQKQRLPAKARKSLDPGAMRVRLKALDAAAQQALKLATLVNRVDKETGEYLLPEVPPMPGEGLLPHQDEAFLAKLGTYHKLYVGKFIELYSKRRD